MLRVDANHIIFLSAILLSATKIEFTAGERGGLVVDCIADIETICIGCGLTVVQLRSEEHTV